MKLLQVVTIIGQIETHDQLVLGIHRDLRVIGDRVAMRRTHQSRFRLGHNQLLEPPLGQVLRPLGEHQRGSARGDHHPPERELGQQFGVSRTAVREGDPLVIPPGLYHERRWLISIPMSLAEARSMKKLWLQCFRYEAPPDRTEPFHSPSRRDDGPRPA